MVKGSTRPQGNSVCYLDEMCSPVGASAYGVMGLWGVVTNSDMAWKAEINLVIALT